MDSVSKKLYKNSEENTKFKFILYLFLINKKTPAEMIRGRNLENN